MIKEDPLEHLLKHSNKKQKDTLEGSLDQVLIVAEDTCSQRYL